MDTWMGVVTVETHKMQQLQKVDEQTENIIDGAYAQMKRERGREREKERKRERTKQHILFLPTNHQSRYPRDNPLTRIIRG